LIVPVPRFPPLGLPTTSLVAFKVVNVPAAGVDPPIAGGVARKLARVALPSTPALL
jgi:hypothetical protein